MDVVARRNHRHIYNHALVMRAMYPAGQCDEKIRAAHQKFHLSEKIMQSKVLHLSLTQNSFEYKCCDVDFIK